MSPTEPNEFTKKKSIKKIIFIDDEEMLCKIFKKALEKYGYNVRVAYNGSEGLKLFKESPADLVITDIVMPETDGHALINEIMQEQPETTIFAITGHQTYFGIEWNLDIAKILGAKHVFIKPVKIDALLKAIKDLEEN